MRTGLFLGMATGVALAALASAAPAQAQIAQSLLGKMFGGEEEPAINYSERAPIVIPPRRDLTQPGDPDALAQDPAWPKDPDVKKKMKKREGVGPATSKREEFFTPDELSGYRGGDQRVGRRYGDTDEYTRLQRPVTPLEMKKRLRTEDEAPLVPGVEPARRSLSDPPAGLRVPLATAPLGGNEPLPSQQGDKKPWYKGWFGSSD